VSVVRLVMVNITTISVGGRSSSSSIGTTTRVVVAGDYVEVLEAFQL